MTMTDKKNSSHSYLKYSGMAMQLFGLNLFAILIGQWADKKFEFETDYVTMALIVIFNVGFFYKLYLDLSNDDKRDE